VTRDAGVGQSGPARPHSPGGATPSTPVRWKPRPGSSARCRRRRRDARLVE